MSDQELEDCKKVQASLPPSMYDCPPPLSPLHQVIKTLQDKEASNDSLSLSSTGTRSKGAKRSTQHLLYRGCWYIHVVSLSLARDEQYRSLWTELESLTETFSSNSDNHRRLAEVVTQATNHAPSMQLARKNAQGPMLSCSHMTSHMTSMNIVPQKVRPREQHRQTASGQPQTLNSKQKMKRAGPHG